MRRREPAVLLALLAAILLTSGLHPHDVPDLRRRSGARASKPAVMPLLNKPTAAELTAAEKEANCLVRRSEKSSDLLTVIDETMKDRQNGVVTKLPTP